MVAVLAFSAAAMPELVARADTSVVGDDEQDAYVGTGGLLLPGSFSGSHHTRVRVATCKGCHWRYTIHCQYGADGLCQHAVATCPQGKVRYRVWFAEMGQMPTVVGTVCWGVTEPLTRTDLESVIRNSQLRRVPPLAAGMNPPGKTFTSVPVIVFSGQPIIHRPPDMRIAGFRVQVKAQCRWRWAWGDGQAEWRAIPGAPYPRRDITHQYRAAGSYVVKVRSHWSAKYTVTGIGTFDVGGEQIHQDQSLKLTVVSARTLLTPWH